MTLSKRSLRLLCILLLTSIAQLVHAQTNWAMPAHDAQHSGRANFAGPTSAPVAPSWTFSTATPIAGDIVTSAEGTLYFASHQLYALNPDGTTFAPSISIGVPATGPVVDDSSGLVYIAVSAVDGGFDLLSFTKQLQGRIVVLHVPRPPNGAIISPLVLGRGGLVFFVAGRFPGVVYAAGPLQWSNPVCPGEAGPNTPFGVLANSPVVSADGSTLFVMCGGGSGGQDGLLRLQSGTGTVVASSPTNRNSVEPALDSLLHVRSGWQAFGGAIFCGDYLTWDFSLTLLTTPAAGCDSSRFTTSRPAVFPDGQSTVRIGFAFPPNNQLDAEGINNWIVSTDGSTVPNFTSLPSVDAAGNVFIGNTQGIEALSAIDGHILWFFSTGDQITTQPVIANGGALYVGSSSGKVYAFNAVPAHQNGTVYVSGSGAGFATVDLLRASVTATNNTFTDGGVIAVSPDGTRSYVSAIFGLAVVDNTTNQVLTTISVGSRPEWVALSPDGSRIYVSQPNISSVPGVLQGVYVIDAATNAIIASIPVPGPQRVAVAPDNSRVYVGSGGRGIAVIDPATNTVVRSIDIPGAQTTGIAFTPDGAHAYVGEFSVPFLYVIDAHADTLLQNIQLTGSLGGGVGGVIASPDGSKIYAGNIRNGPFVTAPRNVFVIDTATNTSTGQIPVSAPSPQFAISSDGANLLVGDSDIGSLIVASLTTNSVIESIHVNDPCCPGITGIGAAPLTVQQPPTSLPGTISVSTDNAAATFTITDGVHTFSGSGTAFAQTAPAGKYTITFDPIAGFITPSAQTKILGPNSKIEFITVYLQHIAVSPSTLVFDYPKGAAGLIPQQELLIQSSVTPVHLSISTSTETGGNWLSVSAANPSTPAHILIGVNSGLPQGQYQGAVHIHAFGSVDSNDLTVPVTLNVAPAAAVQINVELLDPAPVVENMQIVNSDTAAHIALLSSPTLQPLEGAATDGASKLLVRVSVSQPGETVLFLTDSLGENSLPPEEAGTIPTDTLLTVGDNKVFAVYGAPDQFARAQAPSDADASQRQIYLRVIFIPSNGPAVRSELFPIILERPPIVLIHGLWSDDSAWDSFPLTSSLNCADTGKFYACRINYGPDAANSFATIASEVGPVLRAKIAQFRKDRHVAALQADVIAHSMGGDIVRTLPLCNSTVPNCTFAYRTSANLGLGDVHRLVTIGTPHLGTPIANDLIQHLTTRCCPSSYPACFGHGPLFRDAFKAATSNSLDDGAVRDLQDNSTAIDAIRNSTPIFPMHFVVGIASSADESLLDAGLVTTIRSQCSSNILPEHIRSIFNMDSDLLVPENSERNTSVIVSSHCVTRSLNLIHTSTLINPGQTGFSPDELSSPTLGLDILKILDSPASFCK